MFVTQMCSAEVVCCLYERMLLSSGLLNPMKRELLLRLQSEIENVTDAWLSTALKSLLLIQSRSEYNTAGVYLPTTQADNQRVSLHKPCSSHGGGIRFLVIV